jgi:membrane protease YdiL (CAAX protease family)
MSHYKRSIEPEQKRAMLLAVGLFIIVLAAFAIWGYHQKSRKLRFGHAQNSSVISRPWILTQLNRRS